MATNTFVTGDNGRVIKLTLTDNGVPYDLSAVQGVVIRWKQRGVVTEKPMVIDDPVNGVCSYKPTESDFVNGEVSFEVEVVNANGSIISSQDLLGPYKIRKELG